MVLPRVPIADCPPATGHFVARDERGIRRTGIARHKAVNVTAVPRFFLGLKHLSNCLGGGVMIAFGGIGDLA
jgi:hypothetical protein